MLAPLFRNSAILLTILFAYPFASAQNIGDERMNQLWEELRGDAKESTNAVLEFSTHPKETLRFFERTLKPLKIDEDSCDKLIQQLTSDDDQVTKEAFEKLQYFDPRLAFTLDEIMERYDDPKLLGRLAEIFSDYKFDSLSDQNVQLRTFEYQGKTMYNFVSERGSWSANPDLSLIGTARYENQSWNRIVRAIVMLDHFDTETSNRLLIRMATGNPKAAPTILARNILLERKRKDEK